MLIGQPLFSTLVSVAFQFSDHRETLNFGKWPGGHVSGGVGAQPTASKAGYASGSSVRRQRIGSRQGHDVAAG